MKRKRFSVEQIVAIVKQAEMGMPVAELIRRAGISEQTFYRWKKQFTGLEIDQVRQLKQLQDENGRLKIARKLLQHQQRCIPLSRAARLPGHGIYDQPVSVLHQQVTAIAQLRFFTLAFTRQLVLGIGVRFMRVVRAPLATETHRGVAKIIGRRLPMPVFRLKALHARPSFQQRAIDSEMLVRRQALLPCLFHHLQ